MKIVRAHSTRWMMAGTITFAVAIVLSAMAACDSGGASECDPACPSTSFCCLGSCQPRGSVCGAGGGTTSSTTSASTSASVTASSSSGGGDPCVLHGGATSVVTACAPDGTIHYCGTSNTDTCNQGYVCVDWVDPMTGVLDAYCPMQNEADICDVDVTLGHCVGNVAHTCIGTHGPNDPPTAPGHYQDFDCKALHGPSSQCIEDAVAGPSCTP